MKLVLISSIPLTVYLLKLHSQAFIVREILVNDPVTFPCTCSGNWSVVLWTRFIPSKAVIAKGHKWTCQFEQNYQKRWAVSGDTSTGNFSMTIRSAVYNDAGSYRCTCDGDPVTEVKLKVYVPTVVKAFEGENVSLPCYGDTQQGVKDVKWRKGGRTFLLYTHENRSVTTEEASAGRYIMSVEGFLDGELSLHISSVHRSDAGFYQCLLHDESREGEPRAVLLKVQGLQQLTTTNCNEGVVLAVLLGLFAFIGIISVIIYIGRRCAQ